MTPKTHLAATLLLGLAAAALLACEAAGGVPAAGDPRSGAPRSGVPAPDGSRGFRGYLAVRGDRVLAAENPGRLFTPASVLKLVVAAAALHHLGPEYRVTTRLAAGGEVSGAPGRRTLDGDLIVEAAADPTWSERFFAGDPRAPLDDLARQLRGRGVARIAGDLVIDTRRFPGRPHPLSRPLAELAYGYAAATSALAVDENSVEVEIAPGRRAGEPGTVRLARPGPLRVAGRIRTVSKKRHGKGTVGFQPVWGSSTVVVRGEYPVSEPPYRIALAVPSGDLYAGGELAAALRRQGVELAGGVRVTAAEVSSGPVLAEIRSPPLAALLAPILTDSSNWHAEMLLRLLAAEVLGEGRYDEALELEGRFLTGEVGLAPGSFALDDASGLSPYNLLSPEAVVALLRYVLRQPWGRLFLDALATPGNGTLEVWRGLPPVAAKTGTIENAMGLAGYLGPASRDPLAGEPLAGEPLAGEPLVFACFLNHRPGDRGRMRREIADLVRRWQRAGGPAP